MAKAYSGEGDRGHYEGVHARKLARTRKENDTGDALKEVCQCLAIPGAVHVIVNDLSNGPLADGRVRGAYWRELTGEAPSDPLLDVFGKWRELIERTSKAPLSTVVAWHTDAVSEPAMRRVDCACANGGCDARRC